MAILFRSIAFNVLFYLNTIIHLVAGLPTFFMPYRAIIGVAKSWGRINLVLLRAVAGIDCEVRGRDKIPKGPLIVASKHQSAWETLCAAAAARKSGVHSQARAAMDSNIRLADHQGSYGAGPSRRRLAGPPRHDRARPHRTCGQSSAHHFS